MATALSNAESAYMAAIHWADTALEKKETALENLTTKLTEYEAASEAVVTKLEAVNTAAMEKGQNISSDIQAAILGMEGFDPTTATTDATIVELIQTVSTSALTISDSNVTTIIGELQSAFNEWRTKAEACKTFKKDNIQYVWQVLIHL